MQSKILIPFPVDLKSMKGVELISKLQQEIHLHKYQIGYMIQDYFPQQKVRVAELLFRSTDGLTAFVKFSLEEFSSCAAIDTYELSGMEIQVILDHDAGAIEIIGEQWAE